MFDASIKKKKKTKKKIFDIEAALSEGNDADLTNTHENSNGDKENQEPSKGNDMDFDGNTICVQTFTTPTQNRVFS